MPFAYCKSFSVRKRDELGPTMVFRLNFNGVHDFPLYWNEPPSLNVCVYVSVRRMNYLSNELNGKKSRKT